MLVNIHPGRYLHYKLIGDVRVTEDGNVAITNGTDTWDIPKEKFVDETAPQAVERIAGTVNSLYDLDRHNS